MNKDARPDRLERIEHDIYGPEAGNQQTDKDIFEKPLLDIGIKKKQNVNQ